MDNTIWDPLRRKYVALTPEERVRQWFIRFLADVVRVPVGLMTSEAAISLGPKHFRADILIYDRSASPLAVVECKRPEVALDATVLDQAVRYNMVLNVKYIIITNGTRTFIARRDGGKYEFIEHVPSYEEMTEK